MLAALALAATTAAHKPSHHHPLSTKASSGSAINATISDVRRARILAVAPAGHVDVALTDGFGRSHIVFAPAQAIGTHVVASIETHADACGKQYITVAFADGTHADTTIGYAGAERTAIAADGPDAIRIAAAESTSTPTALLQIRNKQFVVEPGSWPVKEPASVTIESIGGAGMALTIAGTSELTIANTGATIAPASEAGEAKKKSLFSTIGSALGLPGANAQPSC